MTNPMISVLLCTYNDSLYIREAIESILNQTFKNFEFLIVDDGSTDDTASIIQSFSDRRIIYLKNTKNEGLEFSKNRGIETAKTSLTWTVMIKVNQIAYRSNFP